MEDIRKRLEQLEYYVSLLVESDIMQNLPFLNWVIKNNRTKKEIEHIFLVCEEIDALYKKQKAEGFLHFHPLLQIFQEKTKPYIDDIEEFTFMMVREKLFADLMKEFLKIQHDLN